MTIPLINLLRPDQLLTLTGDVNFIVGQGTRYGISDFTASDIENAGTNAAEAAVSAAAALEAAAEAEAAAAAASATIGLSVNTPSNLSEITPDLLAVGNYVIVRSTGKSYLRVTSGGDLDYTGSGGVMLLTQGRLEFFNFLTGLTEAERAEVRAGTYVGDLATQWTAFHAALQAQSTAGIRPHGMIEQCTIYTSVSPNFAMDFLRLETQGNVRVINTAGLTGIKFDGAGIGVNDYGIRHMIIDPIEGSTVAGALGYEIVWCHKSVFRRPISFGGVTAGIKMAGCVTSVMDSPQVSDQVMPWLSVPPFFGIWLTSAAGTVDGVGVVTQPCSWVTLINPVGEYATDACISVEFSYGLTIVGGTAEGGGYGASAGLGAGRGLVLGPTASYSKIYSIDCEYNVGNDILCVGFENDFFGVDSQDTFLIDEGTAKGNRVIGGKHGTITFGTLATFNLVTGLGATTITDNGTGNRVHNCLKLTAGVVTAWHDDWVASAPVVTATTPSLTTYTSYFAYRKIDGTTFICEGQIAISNNGSGDGALQFTLPFTPAFNGSFTGSHTLSGVVSAVVVTFSGGSATATVKLSTNAYPGGTGAAITFQGTFRK